MKNLQTGNGGSARGKRGNLVLERKAGESFRIGDSTVTLVKIVGNRISLAIQADKSVPIVRTEIEGKERKVRDAV